MTPAERERLIIEHMPVVESVARHLATRLPYTIDPDELVAIGYLALVRAVDSHQPDHPSAVPLRIWIRYKVRGEIIEAYSGRNYRYELHAPLPPPEAHPDNKPTPVLNRIYATERLMLVDIASRRLKRRERAVLRATLRGETMARAGRRLGISERRAGQIRQVAVERVKASIQQMHA